MSSLAQNQHSRPHPDLAKNGEDLAANGAPPVEHASVEHEALANSSEIWTTASMALSRAASSLEPRRRRAGEGVGVVALFRRDAATGRLAPTEARA